MFFIFFYFLDETLIDPLEHDPEYTKKIMEFESTLQEKIKEELEEEEGKLLHLDILTRRMDLRLQQNLAMSSV